MRSFGLRVLGGQLVLLVGLVPRLRELRVRIFVRAFEL